MQNSIQPDSAPGFWRLYATRERGWIALCFFVLSIFVVALFNHPAFDYRGPNASYVMSLQLAFTAGRFKKILDSWEDIALFKKSLWQIDYIFPLVYTGLLAFGYAWSRRNEKPTRPDRFFFLAPFVAAFCDWVENSLHLYLLRNVSTRAQAQATNFSDTLVFAASVFAVIKILLIALVAGAIIVLLLRALFRNLPRVGELLPYVYLLRIPALTATILIGLVYTSFFTGARSLLENLFDLRASGIFFVSLVAFLAAWTVLVTLRLLLLYGHERFGVTALAVPKRFGWGYFARHGLIALPLVAATLIKYDSQVRYGRVGAVLMAVLGLLASLGILWVAMWLQRYFTWPGYDRTGDPEEEYVDLLLPSPRPGQRLLNNAYRANSAHLSTKWLRAKLEKLFAFLGPGYFDSRRGGVLEGHLLSASLFLTSLLIYLGIGVGKFSYLGDDSGIPALSYLLWLVLLLSWGLSALSFFFDRYRLPVLIPLALWLILAAQLPQSDHYYNLIPPEAAGTQRKSSEISQPLTPGEAMREIREHKTAEEPNSLIVVAISGGGIQAAAWAAQVLTGLEAENQGKFGRNIHLISSVSGGSVGAMYFANAYQGDGSLDPATLPKVVEQAMHSSIDAVGWGLVYPDFLRLACPPCGFFMKDLDRGQALEVAWLQADGVSETGLPSATLAKWKGDAQGGRRPYLIFNTTITETGERLPLATSVARKSEVGRGSRGFSQLYDKHDLRIVTAARLSATFPYASPAARANIKGPQYHVVDGGYYDNYGISSLSEWLDVAFQDPSGNAIKRLLMLQIRAFPSGDEDDQSRTRPAGQRGWFYQAFAPVSTLLNVRTAGQSAHNQVELDLLQKVLNNRGVDVKTAEFEFRNPDSYSSCKSIEKNYAPPLSWHLTRKQKDEIRNEWQRVRGCTDAIKVREFLNGSASQPTTLGAR